MTYLFNYNTFLQTLSVGSIHKVFGPLSLLNFLYRTYEYFTIGVMYPTITPVNVLSILPSVILSISSYVFYKVDIKNIYNPYKLKLTHIVKNMFLSIQSFALLVLINLYLHHHIDVYIYKFLKMLTVYVVDKYISTIPKSDKNKNIYMINYLYKFFHIFSTYQMIRYSNVNKTCVLQLFLVQIYPFLMNLRYLNKISHIQYHLLNYLVIMFSFWMVILPYTYYFKFDIIISLTIYFYYQFLKIPMCWNWFMIYFLSLFDGVNFTNF